MNRTLLLSVLSILLPTTTRADAPVLWGVTGVGGAPSSLYAVHPLTGKALKVGAIGLDNVSGISVHPATKLLYATQGQQGGSKSLLILSKTRARPTALGEIGEAVADSAFSPTGVLFGYGASSRDLFTVNLTNAGPSLVKAAAGPIGGCGMTFDNVGNLYMTRSNSIARLDPANGNLIGMAAVIGGATMNVDNLLAVRNDGVMFAGQRNGKAAPTRLFAINSATGNTTAGASIPLALSGMTFDVAPTPGFKVKGSKIRRTSKTTYLLKGIYASTVPATVSFRKTSVVTNSGPWKLKLSKLRTGTNVVKVQCVDAAGQKKSSTVRIIVER